MTNNFKLWFGCLGNGITVCNSAVERNGEYEHIAHISVEGKIKLYVSENYIPDDDMQIIRQTADKQKAEFLSRWNALSNIQKYEKLLDDYVSLTDFFIVCNDKSINLAEKVKRFEAIYIY